jgi:LacI family transcriptional regulator
MFETVGLLVSSSALRRGAGAMEALLGTSEEAQRLGYNLIMHLLTGAHDDERHFVQDLMRHQPMDGLVVIMPEGMLPYVDELAEQGLPVVVVDDRAHRPNIPSVEIANEAGAREAVEHLLRLGRRDIAVITGDQFAYSWERLEGYRAALREARLAFRPELVAAGGDPMDAPVGAKAVGRLMASGVSFDALFACNDEMAIGAIDVLRRAGVRIPEDVAVVGFDDIPAASLTCLRLTTVRQPLYEVGCLAQRKLISLLRGSEVEFRTVVPTTLMVRESSMAHNAIPAVP